MNTAIDFYSRGKEKEAEANEYTLPGYYPLGRFICPECGEEVFLSRSKYKNFFKHRKRTDQTPECERRVDAVPSESIYERIGLPLYLKEASTGYFKLYMGFQSLSAAEIEQAERNKAEIHVNNKIAYRVTRERFSDSHSFWIPIDFAPFSDHYTISYKGDKASRATFERTWGGLAEAFMLSYGALFRTGNGGGRKFHKGDSVATDTDYFWVIPDGRMLSGRKGITCENRGKLELENRKYDVVLVSFRSDVSDMDYSALSLFLLKELKIHLLEKASSIIPIWPPVVKQQDRYIANKKLSSLFGSVESGNVFPSIYGYYKNDPVPNFMTADTESIIRLPLRQAHQYFTVDRRNVSTGLILEKGDLCVGEAVRDIEVEVNGVLVDLPGKHFEVGSFITIESSRNVDVIVKRRNKIDFFIQCSGQIIKNLLPDESIFVIYGPELLLMVRKEETLAKGTFSINLDELMQKYARTYMVSLPYAIRQKLLEHNDGSPLIRKIIAESRLPLAVVRYLERSRHV